MALRHTPEAEIATKWTIDDSRELYNIEGWGIGYFDVNQKGHVTVHPTKDPARGLDLFELATDLEAQGVRLPLLLRFSDILRTRIENLGERFATAIRDFGYEGGYTTVYPIKVNQQRHVVEEIVAFGERHGVGLEVGSKPELQAVLALTERTDHLIVCNGYKDEEFMRLALMGQKLGHRVIIVIEKLSEVDVLLKVADEMGVEPTAGVRIKLSATGAGRWSETAGEKSKFGLNPSQLMRVYDKLREAGKLHILKLVHFHLGSQIPDIRNIKLAMTEVSRYYVEIRQLGVEVEFVDVGGGLGVDYDGSRSPSAASVNYSMQEYANDIVYSIAEACRENEVPMPHIISESGRALTAHHALLLINVIDLETQASEPPDAVTEDDHTLVQELAGVLRELDGRSLREVYHDATFIKGQLQIHFNSGTLTLRERAVAERYWLAIMNRVAQLASRDPEEHDDILPELEGLLIDRYFCNFSLFQSLPDSWAIDQLFPIMPVHRLDEEPTRRGTLQDVTCDSDGKIDQFVGWKKSKPSLELHSFDHDEKYVLGIFLTGAYQEILGDLHNLFGDTNAVHIRLSEGGYEIGDLVHGDTITEVLNYVQFNTQDLISTFRRKISNARDLTRAEANAFIADYIAGLAGYTYLEDEA
ncbi:biosynthetic arginine decarboxylase [Longimicrobium terrae]|uniref:Biosynthetic arginine decarboxylase n=1 Tax=Longimicrobium terrae TaxID=1639882 RepID=A0A841H6U9_9BACT|nr:biosynthetic arginine decarboxylase [Longimicrobium terrae]MBB4639478.1 arginine decarboxylase [Longimicrobium terrae]MBB6073850.1 arginine decarboxylase [Longimicrobium terrae]NNC32526.1 biosynthetic arginine decarboxylase [Longimicrobium terrae]